MTDQALRNNYLHKIPSPFSFGEGQREGEKKRGGSRTESKVCSKESSVSAWSAL